MYTDVRDTSIEAYHGHKTNGQLSNQQAVIIDALTRAGRPLTRREIERAAHLTISSVCGRVNELLTDGTLLEEPRRECSITGKAAHPVRLA